MQPRPEITLDHVLRFTPPPRPYISSVLNISNMPPASSFRLNTGWPRHGLLYTVLHPPFLHHECPAHRAPVVLVAALAAQGRAPYTTDDLNL